MFEWLQSAIAVKIIIGGIMFVSGWIGRKLKIPVDNKKVRFIVEQVVKGSLKLVEDWKSANEAKDGLRKLTKAQKASIHGSAANQIIDNCTAAGVTPPDPDTLDVLIKGAVKVAHESMKE